MIDPKRDGWFWPLAFAGLVGVSVGFGLATLAAAWAELHATPHTRDSLFTVGILVAFTLATGSLAAAARTRFGEFVWRRAPAKRVVRQVVVVPPSF